MILAVANLGVSGRKQTLTLADSYNLYVFMSTISPVSPSIPHECSPFACFAYEEREKDKGKKF